MTNCSTKQSGMDMDDAGCLDVGKVAASWCVLLSETSQSQRWEERERAAGIINMGSTKLPSLPPTLTLSSTLSAITGQDYK